jgi:hypothetical protein
MQAIEAGVGTIPFEKLFVRATLGHAPFYQAQYLRGIAHGKEIVRDHAGCESFHASCVFGQSTADGSI